MKMQNGHLHAVGLYKPISKKHFLSLCISLFYGKIVGAKSVTVHLPLEILHPKFYKNLTLAKKFINFGEFLTHHLKINLFWENAPLLNYETWTLKHGQNSWKLIPKNIYLCLDTGHLILGARNTREARKRIVKIFNERKNQIRHLHIHENDLKSDSHEKPGKVVTKLLLKKLTKSRSFIYEE